MATTKWALDQTHAEIHFKIRHMMVSTVTGSFGKFNSTIETTDDNFETAKISFTAEIDSISTNNAQRDGHLKSGDFFEQSKYPTLSFKSTKFEKVSGEHYTLYGDLTLHGVTKNIKLTVEHGGVIKDPYGFTRTGFGIEGKIDRKDFNLSWNGPLDNGGVILSDEVKIQANIEFIKQA
jgi:polyisoprenoid-binding protein YceI